jgi:hypothetical protein
MYKGYDFFYAIGSSHTAGGGFSPDVVALYKNLYNVEIPIHLRHISWAHFLSKNLGIRHVNDAQGGASITRSVRKTFEFLEQNQQSNFFVIFEYTEPGNRTDVFDTKSQKYTDINLGWDRDSFSIVPPSDTTTVYSYVSNHLNFKELQKFNERYFLGLYSLLKRINIPVKVMLSEYLHDVTHQLTSDLLDKRMYIDDEDIIPHVHEWAHHQIHPVMNHADALHNIDFTQQRYGPLWFELPGYSNDGHPGYFAHQKYADLLKTLLDENLNNRDK